MEFTLLWAVLTAAGASWLGTRIWPDGLPERPMDGLLTAALAGLAVGRVAAMIAQGTNPVTNLADLIIVRGGVSTVAASLAFVVTLFLANHRSFAALDALAPSVLAGLAGWHLGCVWRGTCLGTASGLPWAVSGPASEITRHPVEVYAALLLIAAAIVVARLPRDVGVRAGAGLALASGARLLTEPMRLSLTGGPVWWYAVGLLAGVVLAWSSRRRRADPT